MIELLWFVLAAYGLTQILIYGTIFNKIRPKKDWLRGFGELFHCPMCMGFWVGVFLCGVSCYTQLFTFETSLMNLFILGCVSSGTSYILNVLFCDNGIQIGVRNGKDMD
tara:strand:+ start:459 stop:785 length:327 start_codon:yes stop_codon:yes gene_type:complete